MTQTDLTAAVAMARRLVTEDVADVFIAEIANEEAMHREAATKQRPDNTPAATLSSTIDSIRQGLVIAEDGDSEEEIAALVALLGIRDLLPGTYEIRNLLP